jgi:hypothetical protein
MDSRARQLMLLQAIQQRQQPNMAQRLTGLGLYNMEPPAPREAFNEWENMYPEDTQSTGWRDLLGQIDAAARFHRGPKTAGEADQIHTERNNSMNNLGIPSPWQQKRWL